MTPLILSNISNNIIKPQYSWMHSQHNIYLICPIYIYSQLFTKSLLSTTVNTHSTVQFKFQFPSTLFVYVSAVCFFIIIFIFIHFYVLFIEWSALVSICDINLLYQQRNKQKQKQKKIYLRQLNNKYSPLKPVSYFKQKTLHPLYLLVIPIFN